MAGQFHKLRDLVEARAYGRCEYCRRYQELVGETFFEIDHVIPRARGGPTSPHNLAFACRRCNLLKGATMEAADPETGDMVPLFNPRTDAWDEHLRRSPDLLRIEGSTAIGRATVDQLRLNDSGERRARQIQRDYLSDVFPLN